MELVLRLDASGVKVYSHWARANDNVTTSVYLNMSIKMIFIHVSRYDGPVGAHGLNRP